MVEICSEWDVFGMSRESRPYQTDCSEFLYPKTSADRYTIKKSIFWVLPNV